MNLYSGRPLDWNHDGARTAGQYQPVYVCLACKGALDPADRLPPAEGSSRWLCRPCGKVIGPNEMCDRSFLPFHKPAPKPITAGTGSTKGAAAWLRKALARAAKGDILGYRAALAYALADVGQALEETGQP